MGKLGKCKGSHVDAKDLVVVVDVLKGKKGN
jgi:hypothetical protein